MMTIPNLLSIFRIILIPVFSVLFLKGDTIPTLYGVSGIVLAVSGLTDMVDGYIARKFNQESDLGKLLDPIADKLTLAAVVVCVWTRLHQTYAFITPVCAVMLIKELVMMLGGFILMKMGKKMVKAQWWGKVATVGFYLLMTATVGVVFLVPDTLPEKGAIIFALTATAALLMIIALVRYVVLGVQLLRDKGPQDSAQYVNLDNVGGKRA